MICAGLGVHSIFTINFDRTLAYINNNDINVITSCSKPKFVAHASLFRHATINNQMNSRIWYLHGDTESPSTIKLGVRSYGIYIRSLNTAFKAYRKYQKKESFSAKNYRAWCLSLRNLETSLLNWFWLGISSPIIFLGCSLPKEEWPLWWFLHQKSRHLIHYKKHGIENISYILININSENYWTSSLRKGILEAPAGVKILPCIGWEDGWNRFINSMKKI